MSPVEAQVMAAYRALLAGDSEQEVRLPMLSGSMAWTILPGDVLSVRPRPGRRLHRGDVAVFLGQAGLTAHRLIFVLRWGRFSWLLEMGDQNRLPGILGEDRILGVVVGIERQGQPVPLERGHKARRTAWRLLAAGSGRWVLDHIRFKGWWRHG